MGKKEPADLSDKATLFQAYVDLVNSERETIWARHNALLVANSLIVGALAVSPAAFWTSKWAPIAMLGAGMLISIAWFDHLVWLVGDAAACRGCQRLCRDPFQASAKPVRRPQLSPVEPLDSRPRAHNDRHLHPHLSRAGLYPTVLGLGPEANGRIRGSARHLASS